MERELRERINEISDALVGGQSPYDEWAYRALVQIAHEMQTWGGLDKWEPEDQGKPERYSPPTKIIPKQGGER